MSTNEMEFDSRTLYQTVIDRLQEALGEIVNPGDERRIVAEVILSVFLDAIAEGKAYAKGQLYSTTYGEMMDLLFELLSVYRLPAATAVVPLQFTVAAPAGVAVTIPAGTRVTADGSLYFATVADAIAVSGAVTVAINASAAAPGARYNGLPIGSITTMVDPVAYVTAVTNTAVTSGGADTEDDDSFRERARIAPRSYSTAGPADAYVYWAKTASSAIADVVVTTPSACNVTVTVLMEGGALPQQTDLDAVAAVLSATTIRPLTDQVTVAAPTAVSYTATATYYLSADDPAGVDAKKAACEAGYAAYLLWQKSKLGRDINPDELRRRLLDAGAVRVVLTSPDYTAVAATEVAVDAAESALTYGGTL